MSCWPAPWTPSKSLLCYGNSPSSRLQPYLTALSDIDLPLPPCYSIDCWMPQKPSFDVTLSKAHTRAVLNHISALQDSRPSLRYLKICLLEFRKLPLEVPCSRRSRALLRPSASWRQRRRRHPWTWQLSPQAHACAQGACCCLRGGRHMRGRCSRCSSAA